MNTTSSKTLRDETGPLYRYAIGTSMAAPAIAWLLAQIQEFFQRIRPCAVPWPPATRPGLLNSALPTSTSYQPDPAQPRELHRLGPAQSAPGPTSLINDARGQPLYVIESDDDAGLPVGLATGESRSYQVTLSSNVLSAPLRITLVWTDPPANPPGRPSW
jgi:hypothetical protein